MHSYSLNERTVLHLTVVFFAYLLTAQIFSYFYTFVPTSPALIWPASGIALAGLLLGGIGLWPAIFFAALAHQILNGSTLFVALGLAVANALQAYVAAYILKRTGASRISFSLVPHTVIFVVVAIGVTAIVPGLGTLVFMLFDRFMPRGVMGTFIPWWIGQILSVLIVTPLLMRSVFARTGLRKNRIELMEAMLALASLCAVSILLFWTPYREIAQVPLVYLIMPPLLWLALRIGPRFMTLALFLNASIALSGTAFTLLSRGESANLGYALLQTEVFVIVISLIFLLLVTVAEERKNSADDLRENVRRLEDAVERIRKEDEAKSRFIATLAHELRNPLAPLMSSLEIMRLERGNADRAVDLAEGMTGHLKTMRHLLDDLLDISRISREKLALQKEQVDLNAIVQRSIKTVESLVDERGHTLVTDIPNHAILLEADPVRLEQVFVNLLNNAAKYTEPGGTVTVTIRLSRGFVHICVKDTGIGMDAALLEHVFEPFFQIEQPGKMRAGLGIGLSLTKNLVEMHGGTVTATSEGAGRGSEFIVSIPLSSTAVQKEKVKAVVHAKDTEGFRILIVDDNRAAADALAKLLSLRGNETLAVYTGEEAIARAAGFRPDVILLDIGLPDMEGYDVARALRTDQNVTATLVALTGYGQESDIRKAQKAGFNHHLTKPAGLAEIEEILAAIAGS